MKLFIVSVRDRAVDAFGTPFFAQAVGQALRSFTDEVQRESPDNSLNRHPEDYDLYLLGSFDTDHGTFTCDGPPKMIAVGKELRKELPPGVAAIRSA